MAGIKASLAKEEILIDRDFESIISEGEESKCADETWEYYKARKDELEGPG